MPDHPATITSAFVQLCLQARIHPEALDAALELTGLEGFNWNKVVETARERVVTPLLYDRLRDEPDVPADVRQALRSAYTYTCRRNRFLLDELAKALFALEAGGIRPVILKGAALAEAAYGDMCLRQMRDIDLLVRLGDEAAAVRALAPVGYAPINADLNGDNLILYETEVALRKSDIVEVTLALHVRPGLAQPDKDTALADWLWDSAEPVGVGNATGLRPGPDAQVVYLCAHATTNHPGGLLWLHDIAEVLRRDGHRVDWDRLCDRAVWLGVAPLVLPALERLEEGWGASTPAEALQRLRAGSTQAAEVRRGVSRHGMSAWDARLRQAWHRAFPPPDYMRRKYSIAYPWLVPIYYPFRWAVRLIHLLSGLAP